MKKELLAQIIMIATEPNGGCTVDMDGNIPVKGYAVATEGMVYPKYSFTTQDILDFISCNSKSEFIGSWETAGNVFLDHVIIVESLEDALRLGRTYKQQAIYDLERQEEILC